MARHTVRLYKDQEDQFYGKRIKCNRKDIPKNLADIVADYLDNAPYPGPILALVSVGWKYTAYLIELKNGTVIVYRQVFQRNRKEVQS